MTQFWTIMRRGYVLFFVVLAVMCLATPMSVGADQYQFVATVKPDVPGFPSGLSSFSLTYTDLDNNQLFSWNELNAGTFSGMMFSGIDPFLITFTELSGVPNYDSIDSPLTNGGTDPALPIGIYHAPDAWLFASPDINLVPYLGVNDDAWTYTQTAVPLPGAALLLGAGLVRLAAHARRQKRLG
jgi:hypothetical protein